MPLFDSFRMSETKDLENNLERFQEKFSELKNEIQKNNDVYIYDPKKLLIIEDTLESFKKGNTQN